MDYLNIASFLVIFIMAVQYFWDHILAEHLPKARCTKMAAQALRYIIMGVLIASAILAAVGIICN